MQDIWNCSRILSLTATSTENQLECLGGGNDNISIYLFFL